MQSVKPAEAQFTFQYGSINTESEKMYEVLYESLHSNMVLLIHKENCSVIADMMFTFQYGSINTGSRNKSPC